MACQTLFLHGIIQDCNGNLGGVSDVWLINREDISAVTVSSAYTINGISGVPMISTITLDADKSFKHFYVRKNTSSMNSTLNVNDNGSSYVTTELNLVFARMDAQKRLEMNALAKEDIAALVKDANGTWFYLGKDNPVTSSAGTGETGVQKSDNNQYTSTLLDDSTEYPYIVDPAAIEALGLE